jgi:hypothetical protein
MESLSLHQGQKEFIYIFFCCLCAVSFSFTFTFIVQLNFILVLSVKSECSCIDLMQIVTCLCQHHLSKRPFSPHRFNVMWYPDLNFSIYWIQHGQWMFFHLFYVYSCHSQVFKFCPHTGFVTFNFHWFDIIFSTF